MSPFSLAEAKKLPAVQKKSKANEVHKLETTEALPVIPKADEGNLIDKLDTKLQEIEILSADRMTPVDPDINDTLYDCLNEVCDYSKRISAKIDPHRFSPSFDLHSSPS